MTKPLASFDELLDLAKPGSPVKFHCKAWSRDVWLRDPTAGDLDAWRVFCNKNKDSEVAFAARLVQLLLCDAEGKQLIPQDKSGLEAIANLDGRGIVEIAEHAAVMISGGDKDLEEDTGNS